MNIILVIGMLQLTVIFFTGLMMFYLTILVWGSIFETSIKEDKGLFSTSLDFILFNIMLIAFFYFTSLGINQFLFGK